MSYIILDGDFLAYTVAAVFQKTTIKLTHPTIPEQTFKSRTEAFGHWKKREGGWLADYNLANFTSHHPDEFTITDHVEALSLRDAKQSLSTRIQGLLQETGAEHYKGFVGRGELDRVEISTLLEYKGNRTGMARPIHLEALKDYMVSRHNCQWAEDGRESDDHVAEAGYAAYLKWKDTKKDDDKGIITFVDKDLVMVDGWQYHSGVMDKPELRVGLGSIERDEKGKVRGWGRKHFYWQVMTGDSSDNYFANCFSTLKWGDIAGYSLLADCKTDKACFEALVKGFKVLYPEPKTVIGWQGKEILIDWLYVLEECFNLAKMLRTKDEPKTKIKDILDKLKIEY